MNWLTLSPLEFAAMFAAASGVALWFYLVHQRPRQKVVSTLRFWQSMEAVMPSRRRRRIREPFPLLAQLLFLLLAILALANPQWAGRSAEPNYVALVLDSSLWAQVKTGGDAQLMDRVRSEAGRFLGELAPGDQVMVVRADAAPAAVVPFTSDRGAVRRAMASVQPSDSIADLPRALELARAAVAGRSRGAIVYVGPGMLDDTQKPLVDKFTQALETAPEPRPQLLVRNVLPGAPGAPLANRGITRLALRRDPAQPDRWHLLAQVKNYDAAPAATRLRISVGSRVVSEVNVSLAPGETAGSRTEFSWSEAGLLMAELSPADALDADNRALAHLPAFRTVRVAVFSPDSSVLRSVLGANPFLKTEFLPPGGKPSARPQVAIYDGTMPADAAQTADNAILFLRGGGGRQVRLTAWNPQHPVTRWVRTRDVSVQPSAQLRQQGGDTVLAWAEGAPVAVAREERGRKAVVVGFDPRQSNLPLQPAFPLLLAGAIEWMTGTIEESSEPAAAGEVTLAGYEGLPTRVLTAEGSEIPAAHGRDNLLALVPRAGLYRIETPFGERQLVANVPPLPNARWLAEKAQSAKLRGRPLSIAGLELWRWLLLAALVPLWAEWFIGYRRRAATVPAAQQGGSA